jgi:hypothetical protein
LTVFIVGQKSASIDRGLYIGCGHFKVDVLEHRAADSILIPNVPAGFDPVADFDRGFARYGATGQMRVVGPPSRITSDRNFVTVLLGLGSRVCQRFIEQLYQGIPIEGVGLSLVELHELLDLRLDGDVGLLTFGDDHVAPLRVGL